MTARMPRRQLLATLAAGGFTAFAGCTDSLLGSTPSPTPTPTATPSITEKYPEVDSPTEKQAAKYVDTHFSSYATRFRSFLQDDSLDQEFVDEQLSLWLSGPADWQEAIIAVEDGLYQDDWTHNGRPHVLPDGSKGPAYDSPFTLRSAPDGWLLGYFNSTGKEYDVRTGDHIGFQPEKTFGPKGNLQDFGDKVGLKGDMEGNGSIADYLDGITRDDLDPTEMHTVIAYNWMEEDPDPERDHDRGPHRPTEECFAMMKEMMAEKVPEHVFQEVMEENNRPHDQSIPAKVNLHTINLGPIPFKKETHPGPEATSHYRQNMPEELRGPVTYSVYVDNNPSGALGLDTESDEKPEKYPDIGHAGNITFLPGQPKHTAGMTFEETYWHGVAQRAAEPESNKTLTAEGTNALNFLDNEWKHVIEGMNADNRNFYRTPVDELDQENS